MEILEFENLISFVISPSIQGSLLVVKIVFIFFSLFFLGGTIYFLFHTTWLKRILLQDLVEILTYRPYWIRKITRVWRKIIKRLETGLESEYKLAVIEADSLLNDTLKRMGYFGESLGERLEKLTKATLPNIEQVWEAHKTRNNIIHDPDYRLALDQAKGALAIYEQALRNLQMFD